MRVSFIVKIVTICLVIAVTSCSAFAKTETIDFSAKALLPDNQKNQGKSYFDLRMKPGQNQTIEVRVSNHSLKSMKIKIECNTAFTGSNGLIDYSENTKRDESMFIDISDIVKLEKNHIVIPASSSVNVPLHIRMPDESYNGILLGGVRISQVEDEQKLPDPKSIAIRNEYVYVIGLKLSQTNVVLKPELHLKYAKPILTNGHTAIAVNIQNAAAIDAQNIKLTVKIYKQGSDTPIRTVEKINISMAPNSNFDFPVEWQDQAIKPGKYRVDVMAESPDVHWEEEAYFEVSKEEASQVNEEAIVIVKTCPVWLKTIAIIALCMVALAGSYWMGYSRRRKKDSNQLDGDKW